MATSFSKNNTTSEFSSSNKSLSMPMRKAIREWEGQLPNLMKEINDIIGVPYTFEFQGMGPGEIDSEHLKRAAHMKDRTPELYEVYLKEIRDLLKENLKDDMTKEGFLEKTDNKKIVIRFGKDLKDCYHKILIDDGCLVLCLGMTNFGGNADYIHYDKLDPLL